MRANSGWLILGLGAAAIVTFLSLQRRGVAALRVDLGRERAAAQTLEDNRREHGRLLAAQPTAGDLDRAAADAAALRQVRAEVEGLQRQIATVEATVETRARPAERFARGQTIPAAEWKNAGSATPTAALETALWAGAGGDVEAFAKMITLIDPHTQKAAQALLDSMPEAMRKQYGTPEQLIAFLTVKDIPLGSVTVRQSNVLAGWPMGEAHQMQVMLTQADGTQKGASLIFLNRGDGWKLVVMESTVAKYAAQLKSAEGAPSK